MWARPGSGRWAARRRRRLRRALGVFGLIAAILLVRQLAPRLGAIALAKREVPCDAVFFYQEDAAWSGDRLGDSERTLGKDGDSVCCLAALMAMEHLPSPLQGALNPGTLNAWLGANAAYDEEGNLLWERVAGLLGAELAEKPARAGLGALMERLLQDEIYAIARVKRPDTGRMHEVLVVGSVHGEFTIVDSLDPTGTLNSLGLYANRVYGLRYLATQDK